jgi:hypothetical protein
MQGPNQATDTAEVSQDGNLSEAEVIALLAGGSQEEQEQPEETPETTEEVEAEEETESEESNSDTEEEEETEAGASEGVEGLDLDSLSDEEWEIVRTKLKSRAAADIQSLKRQLKAHEQTIQALKTQAPTEAAPKQIENNPYAEFKTLDKLEEKAEEIAKVIESTDRILDDHEDYALDDVITVGGKDYTKRQIKEANRNARKAEKDFLPAQKAEIMRGEQRKQLREGYVAKAKEEVKALSDDESEVAKNFKLLTEDKLFQTIREKVPDAEPVMDYILAHFCQSRFGKSSKILTQVTPAKKLKAEPPSKPGGVVSGGPVKASSQRERQVTEKAKRFEETGSQEDLVNFLADRLG